MASSLKCSFKESCSKKQGNAISLCFYATSAVDVDRFKKLTKQNPELVKWRDKSDCDRILLLLAITKHRPLAIIKILIEAWPDSIWEKDSVGKFAIHLACQHHDQVDVIQYLILCSSRCLHKKDNFGNLPLHCVADRKVALPIPILDLLVERYPQSVFEVDAKQDTVLHKLLLNDDLAADYEIINYFVTGGGDCPSVKKRNSRLETPLHLACERSSGNIILMIFKKFKRAAQLKDKNGMLPLHHLCDRDGGPITTVGGELIRAHVTALKVPDCYFNLPLHYVLMHRNEQPFDIIELMTKLFPGALFQENTDGELPLHLACCNYAKEDLVNFLITLEPETVTHLDCKGQFPLHHLLQRTCLAPNSMIELLVQASPPTIAKKIGPFNPFHYAMKYYPDDTVMMMAGMFPQVLLEKVVQDNRIPLAYAINKGKEKLVEYFLHICPASASIQDRSGYLPLHYACQKQPPLPFGLMQLLVDSFQKASSFHCLYVDDDADENDDSYGDEFSDDDENSSLDEELGRQFGWE